MNLDGSLSDDSFLCRGGTLLGFGIAGGGGFTSSISSYISSSITTLFDGSCLCCGGRHLGFGITGFSGFTSSISSYMSSSITTLFDDSCLCCGGTPLGFGFVGGGGFSSESSGDSSAVAANERLAGFDSGFLGSRFLGSRL